MVILCLKNNFKNSSAEYICDSSKPTQPCVFVPRPDGSGSDLVPFPNGGASNNKVYNNIVASNR